MLELAQVVPLIREMGVEARHRGERVGRLMEIALLQASMSQADWVAATTKMSASNSPPWQAAACDEPPGTRVVIPYPPPAIYTVLATDGSQIPMDRHAIAPCYLLNIGEIALHYGTGERPRLTSRATLCFKDDDIFRGGDGSELISEKELATRRLLAESAALASLIAENCERDALALVDDPLILVFADQREREENQREVVDEFCEMLKSAQAARTPIAGYISRPGARDVVGLLRRTLCTDNCGHEAHSPCAQLGYLTDRQLFARILLDAGERSPIFVSAARSLTLYPEDQRIVFFYLNVGHEIARVEIPRWVADDQILLERVHALCCDQSRKGQGYPVALAEAHERAVVRGPDRQAFSELVQAALVRENVPALLTRKALAKRTRIL